MFTWIRNWVDFKQRKLDAAKEATALAEHEEMIRRASAYFPDGPAGLQELVRKACDDQKAYIAKQNPYVAVNHWDWAMRTEEATARSARVAATAVVHKLETDWALEPAEVAARKKRREEGRQAARDYSEPLIAAMVIAQTAMTWRQGDTPAVDNPPESGGGGDFAGGGGGSSWDANDGVSDGGSSDGGSTGE